MFRSNFNVKHEFIPHAKNFYFNEIRYTGLNFDKATL